MRLPSVLEEALPAHPGSVSSLFIGRSHNSYVLLLLLLLLLLQ
jgi:hypothetical protein